MGVPKHVHLGDQERMREYRDLVRPARDPHPRQAEAALIFYSPTDGSEFIGAIFFYLCCVVFGYVFFFLGPSPPMINVLLVFLPYKPVE